MVGELLKGQRHDWILATKLGNKMSDRPNEMGYSRAWVQRACEASLSAWPPTTSTSTTCTATSTAWISRSRCVRSTRCCAPARSATGASPTSAAGAIAEAVHTAQSSSTCPARWCASRTTTCSTAARGRAAARPAPHHGIGVVPYSPIARGVLSGKYTPGAKPAEGTRAGRGDRRMHGDRVPRGVVACCAEAQGALRRKGVSPSHFATAWVLAHRAVSSVIAGPRTFAQWHDYLRRARLRDRCCRRGARRCAGRAGPSVDARLQRPGVSAGGAPR